MGPAIKSTRYPHVQRRPRGGRRPHAVVIGGGLAGLASSALLRRDGYDVDLLECRDHVGGRADELRIAGFRFDTGPTWFLMPEVIEHFFTLMGVSMSDYLDMTRLDPAYRLFAEGEHPINVHTGREPVRSLFESRDPGCGDRLERHLDRSRDTYRLALRELLYTNFDSLRSMMTRDVIRGIPLLCPQLLTTMEKAAARVTSDPILQQMLTFHSVFLSGSPAMLPAAYGLMAHLDLEDGVLHPRGGMRELVTAVTRLCESVGVRIHTRERATRILTRPGGRGRTTATVTGVEVTRVSYEDTLSHVLSEKTAEHVYSADVVISCIDMWASETHLLSTELQTYPQSYWDKSRDGIGTVLAMLGVKGPVDELSHHNFFFTREWAKDFEAVFNSDSSYFAQEAKGNDVSLYVCKSSATDPNDAPVGCESLFLLIPVAPSVRIGRGSLGQTTQEPIAFGDARVEQLVDDAIAQVARWANIPDLASRVVVRRSLGPADHHVIYGSFRGNALGPAHVLSQSAMFRSRSASRKVDGLLYAGQTTTPGVGVPMAIISAENSLKRLRGDASNHALV